MDYETLLFDICEGVATITLNRPDNANALTLQMARDLFDVSMRCEADPTVRCVVITATGKIFCAGGDLKEFNGCGDRLPGHLTETATLFHNAVIRFQTMDPPVIMAVNGTAGGAGISLLLSGDYVMIVDNAKLVMAYTASGLSPDGSSTFFLAKHIGLLRAKELALTNRVLSPAEALDWGLVNKVVTGEELMEEAHKLAGQFASGPSRAFGATKRLLLTAFSNPIETQLEAETQGIVAMAQTHDGRHGIDSFANKKKPAFKGQ